MSRLSEFHEPLTEDEVSPPSPRSTGIVFAVVALIVAALFRSSPAVLWPALLLAGALLAVSWRAPHLLAGVSQAWFRLGLLLNRVVSPVVLAVLYAVAIVPFGLAMQLVRDPLAKRKPSAPSYWIARKDKAAPGSMQRPF